MSFADLKARVVSGTIVVAGAQFLRQLVQLGAVALLARILVPADFGLVALAVGVLAFLQAMADFGLSTALEREKELPAEVESRLFRLNLIAAAIAAGVVMAVAPMIARGLGQPELAWILRMLAFPFLLAGAMRTRTSALARKLQFGRVAAVETVPVVVGTVVSVTLAMRGWGVVALVAGAGIQQITWIAATLATAGIPAARPAPIWKVLPIVRFGASLSIFHVFNTAARKLDDLLVGGVMGVAALGLYEKSYALMMLPVAYLGGPVIRVLYPSLARVRDDQEQFRDLYLGAVRKVAGLSFPAAAVCAAAAGPIVSFVLGARFADAVPIFAVLALTMGIQPLLSIGATVYMARARMRRYLAVGISGSSVLILAFVIGAREGSPLAMARWYTGAYALVFVPLVHVALRTAGVRWRDYLRRVAPPAAAAVATWAVGLATARFGVVWQFPAMAATYVGIHLILDREALLDLVRFLDPRRIVVQKG
ncbi:MAG: oligosaccharide flippase family protein [Planctomycetota bacterium]